MEQRIEYTTCRIVCADVKNFYLEAGILDRFEYMKMPAKLIPVEFMDKYQLHDKVYKGYIYMEIQKGIYHLPQAGILANKLLREWLARDGYYECTHTPGLWRHETRPITFTLVVDDFGIKYINKTNAEHLITVCRKYYTVEVDYTGGWRALLWHQTQLGLSQMIVGYQHANLRSKRTQTFPAPTPKPSTTLSL